MSLVSRNYNDPSTSAMSSSAISPTGHSTIIAPAYALWSITSPPGHARSAERFSHTTSAGQMEPLPPLSSEAEAARRPLPVEVLMSGTVEFHYAAPGRGRAAKTARSRS